VSVVVPPTGAVCGGCAEDPKVSVIIQAQIGGGRLITVQHGCYSNLIHMEHSPQSKWGSGEILLHADKILHDYLRSRLPAVLAGHSSHMNPVEVAVQQ
jgi:hypothetical protein